MRIYIYLLLIFPILLSTFSCSNSPFDSDTTLGSDILNDKDPLLTIFDATFCEDTLDSATGSSFIDTHGSDSLLSGLHKKDDLDFFYELESNKRYYPLYFGSWRNERSFAYLQFEGNKIEEWLNDTNYMLLSFSFNFENLSFLSDPIENTILELGYYDSARKPENKKIDTTKLKSITHYSYNAGLRADHKIPINTEYIATTLPVLNITSHRSVNGYIRTFEIGYDTMHIFDTLQDSIASIRELIVYDSITPVSQLCKEGQLISYSSSVDSTIVDTTFSRDTVITIPDTTVAYTINTIFSHIIDGQDTTDVIEYDTVNILTTISQDTITQKSIRTKRESFALNHEWWDTTATDTTNNICMYVRLDSNQSKIIQFIDSVSLKLKFLKVNENDTVTKTLKPSYYDVSVFETDTSSLDTVIYSSGASGRLALLEVNLKTIWESLKDSTGQILYRNFPRAILTVYPDTIILHKSALGSTPIHYALIDKKVSNIDEIENFNTVSSVSADTKDADLSVNNFLIDMLYTSTPLPDKGYVYIKMNQLHSAHIRWSIPDEGFPISYIISNKE